jgi:chitodextrinase
VNITGAGHNVLNAALETASTVQSTVGVDELHFALTGTSGVAQVSNFTPHAYAGDDVNARTGGDIAFDGERSFDADGTIASYEWDFGDGMTATGSRPRHAYAVPGDIAIGMV